MRLPASAVLLVSFLGSGLPAPADEADAPSAWRARVWPALRVESPGGDLALRLGGRLLLDAAAIDYGSDLTRAPTSGSRFDGDVRQARLFVQGGYHQVELKTEAEFARDDFDPQDFALTDAFLGLRDLPWLGGVRFGHQKNPFSLENAMSRKYMVFMERSLIEELAPSLRDVGLIASNTTFDQRLRWAIGGSRSTDRLGRDWEGRESYLLTARLTGLPHRREEGRSLLHLGLSYSHQFSADEFHVSQTPESFLAEALVATGTIPSVEDVDRLGGELAWVGGPLSVQAEAIGNVVQRDAGSALRFWGASVMASWFVTGEHRVYDPQEAVFTVVRPRRDFAPWRSPRDWGALQLGLRFSHVDLDDREVRGGTQSDLALAASWFLRDWLRVSANYVFGHVESEDDVHVLQMRFQVEH